MKINKKRKKFDNGFKIILALMAIVSVIYVMVAIRFLVPYGVKFFSNHYIIEPNDLPKYSDVFNSIFVILNIIMSTLVSYMIYRLNKNQDKYQYNKEVAGTCLLLFYTIKFNIMRSLSSFLIKHIDTLEDSEYTRSSDGKQADSKEYILTTKCPKFSPEELKEAIPSIIGHIEDEDIRIKFYTLFLDIYMSYKGPSKDVDERILHTLREDLILNDILIEKDSQKWVYVIDSIYKEEWTYLSDDYKKIMNMLSDMSKPKKK